MSKDQHANVVGTGGRSVRSARGSVAAAITAVVAQLLLLDEAVETFWGGSPLRWVLSLPAVLFVVLSVWLWRPGGPFARRFGWRGASFASVLVLLGLLIASAWLPGGQVDGVRLLLQPTAGILILATAVAVGVGLFTLVRATALLPAALRLAARAVIVVLGGYALVALALGVHERAAYAALFQGGSAWQRLPWWLQGTCVGAFGLLPLAIVGQILRIIDHRNRKEAVGGLLRQTAVVAAAVAVAVSGLSVRSPRLIAGSGGSAPAFEITADEVVRVIKAYQDLPAHADRTGFDVKARAATLAGIPAAFAFVRDQIANDLYPGVLRGAEGTLSAGAGNDADKALLLARLLTEQKRTVRFAQCELSEEKAGERLRSVFTRPQGKSSSATEAMLLEALVRQGFSRGRAAEIVDAGIAHEQAIDAAVATAAPADLTTIRETLRAADLAPARRFDQESLVSEARSHVWVQVEEGERWQDLDPAFANAPPGATFCEAEQTIEDLPTEAYQTVTVVVRNEYQADGDIQTATVLEHPFRTSDLHSRATLFLNIPLPLEAVTTGGAAAGQGFLPVLVAADGVVTGEPFPISPQSETKQTGMDSLLGPVGGAEVQSSPGQRARLIGQRLDFVIGGPGRQSTVSRVIFDGVPPDERANGKITTAPDIAALARRLSATYAIAVSTGRIDPVQFLEAAYGHIDASAVGRVLAALASGDLSDDGMSEFVVQQPQLLGAKALRMAVELDRMQSGAWREGYRHSIAFRDQPLIVIADLAIGGPDAEAGLSFDLRNDEIRVMSDDAEHAEEAFWLNAHHGVLDGAVERAALPSAMVLAGRQDWARAGGAHVVSMSTVSELARSSGIGFRAATGADAVQILRGFGLPGGFRLADEVREDTVAVMPAKAVRLADSPRLGIWALNLNTGHVIPLLDTGLRHATSAAADRTAALDGQPGSEYAATQKTRSIDLYWRTTQYHLDETMKLIKQWNCLAGAGGTPQCQILMKAFNKLLGVASELKHQYWAMGEFLGGAAG